MPPIDALPARILPTRWLPALRLRLPFFRLLTLLLALVPLYGVGLTYGIIATDSTRTLQTTAALVLLPLLWAWGYRHRGLALPWLIAELPLYLSFMAGVRDDYGAFGVMYFALQHRAMYGSRRDATVVAFAYAATLVGGYALVPQGIGAFEPIVFIELAVGAFAAYMMHTLSEVLQRDRERKLALLESEQRFRSVIENLREALLITDLDDRISLANQRVRDVLGYEPQELLGRPVTDLVADGEKRAIFHARLERRKRGEPELYEAELVHKDGRVIAAEISAAPIRAATGEIIGTQGAITDISERRELEERLRHTSRMEAIGQLAGGVAHDFNNLLTVIKVHVGLLLAEMEAGNADRDSVTEIERSADRAALLTQQLLAFSRRQLLQPRQIHLADVLDRCESILRSLVDESVSLTLTHDDNGVAVFADPALVEQIVVALVRNANDAVTAQADARIDVRTALLHVSEPMAASGQEIPPGRYMALTVTDTGTGMTADVAARVFEPFVTTKAPGHGSGLGLASVYGAVQQSGGYVLLDTAAGAGTTFWIYFPITGPQRTATPRDSGSQRALVA